MNSAGSQASGHYTSMGCLTQGTIISPERAREVMGEKGVNASSSVVIERMHAYCIGENTGVEFLMLLFAEPAAEGVVPGALLRGLRGCVAKGEEGIVWDGEGLRAEFARDVSLYVESLSQAQGYGTGLALVEPGPVCGVDFFRGFLTTGTEARVLPTIGYIVDQLRALAVLPASTPVKVAVAVSGRSTERNEVAFSLHVVATTRTQARLADVLRRRARSRRAKLRSTISGHGAEEAEWCDAVASLGSLWDGEFDEPPSGAASLAGEVFLPPSLLLYHGQAGGFTATAPGAGGALPYLPRVAEVLK